MKTFPLKVSSPEGDLFSGDAVMLSIRGTEGELAVMAGHIPFVSSIIPCECKISFENGEERIAKTDGGILTVSADKVLFLSGKFEWI